MQFFKILDWDSAFLGYKVAMLPQPNYNFLELSSFLRHLKQDQVKLVYWSAENQGNIDEQQLKLLGGKLVEIKATYIINLEDESTVDFVTDKRVKKYSDNTMHPDLLSLAYESGIYSRFKIDQKIGNQKFEELYKIWMEESVAKKIAKTILVTFEGTQLTGMITLGEYESLGNIGLIAVDRSHREKGLGFACYRRHSDGLLITGIKKYML